MSQKRLWKNKTLINKPSYLKAPPQIKKKQPFQSRICNPRSQRETNEQNFQTTFSRLQARP